MEEKPKSKGKVKFIVLGIFLIAIVVIAFVFDIHKKISIHQIREFIKSFGIWGPLIYMASYAFTSIILFPASLLSTASGAIWGAYLGTFYTVIGATISASLPFGIARFLGRDYAESMMRGSKIDICDRFLKKNGFISVLIMRLVPILPWDVVNYGCGICGFRYRDYFLGTLIGIIPGSFTYNLIGSTLGEPVNHWKIALISGLVVVLSLVTYFTKRKYSKEKEL